MRALLAYRRDVDGDGGAATVLKRTAEALTALGVDVEITYDATPDPTGFDVAHVVNAWAPQSALAQLEHLAACDVPVVFQPFFLGWRELAWAMPMLPAVLDPARDPAERAALLAAYTDGTLEAGGLSRWAPNEIVPGVDAMFGAMIDSADHLVVCSTHEAQLISRTVGLRDTPFTLTRHGVDAARFAGADPAPFRAHVGIEGDFVLCVAAIDARKNQLMLVEALRDLDLDLDLPVVLVGPAYEPHLLDLVLAVGGPRVVHVPRIGPELIASALAAASVHVLPSWAEGAALASLEAASAGCPIVVSDRSSELEYFGDLAHLCDPADPASIRTAVQAALATGRRDGARLKELQARMRELTWARTAEATLAAYERAVAGHTTAHRPAFLADARGFTTVALAEEVLADPALLKTYARAFGGRDDATLVLYAPDADPALLTPRLLEAVALAGLDGDDDADVLALPLARSADDERALACGAAAVLTADGCDGALAALPAFGAGEIDALRSLAERTWTDRWRTAA